MSPKKYPYSYHQHESVEQRVKESPIREPVREIERPRRDYGYKV